MRLLIDQNVADSVGQFFAARGHEVFYTRDVLSSMSPDQLLAFTAETQGLIVVTHDKDFKRYKNLLAVGFRKQFERGAGRISIQTREPIAVRRISEEIEMIEIIYTRMQQAGKRMLISITPTSLSYIGSSRDL